MRICCVVLALAIAGGGGTASGQVATGIPPFSSNTASLFDTVDNANLNVQFEIPVVNKAGRGLPFNYALAFNSSVWSPYSSSGSNAWTPVVNWGWAGTTSASTGFMTYTVTQASCRYPQNPSGREYYWNIYDFRFYYDPNGTPHQFDHTVSNWSSSIPCGNGPPSSYTGTLTDGSGYTINLTSNPSATVYPSSGGAIEPPLQSGSGSGSIQDSNGNELAASSGSTTTFTDTLGVTALIVSGAGTPASPVVYSYPNPSGGTSQVTVNYSAYTVGTNFGCSGITEFKPAAENLVSSIVLADGTSYSFSYDSAGRVTSVTLPAGGKISYAYSGGNNGISCADGSTATLTRTTPDGTWTYTHAESGNSWSTTVTDPQGNQTVYQFQGIYETERKTYHGSASGTLLETIDTCYNGAASPCTGTAVSLPITQRQVTVTLPTGAQAKTVTYYNPYGLPTETEVYDYGPTLVRKTVITYASLGNNIEDRPSEIQVYDGAGALKAQSTYAYDSHGNLTTLTENVTGSSTISRSFSYGTGGVLLTATDFDGHSTSFTYGACSSSFPTSIAQPASLTSSLTWDCNGGVVTSVTDPNNQTTHFSFDEMWRPTATSYPDGGSTSTDYTSATDLDLYTALTSSTSRHDQIVLDGSGRPIQRILVGDPAGADIVDTSYDAPGRVASVTNPYRGSPAGSTSYGYDALGRVTSVTYADGSAASTSYSANCATTADPAGKKRELCSNALGEVTEVVEDPGGLGYVTNYAYDALGNLISVSDGGQTRAYNYDMLSRLISATTPESGTTSYSYTTSGNPCSGDPSNVCTRTDARNITTTYTYDALNRLTSKAYSNDPSHTPTANYWYDADHATFTNWSVSGLTNTKGRLYATCTSNAVLTCAAGYTGTVYSYDSMGRITSYWQATPYNDGSSAWQMTYNYDLAGDVASWTHPAGFTITNTVNTAQEITQIESSLVDSTHPQYLAKNITYTPWGAEATLTNGCASSSGQEQGCTDTLETYAYNNRMQPVMIELGNTSNAAADYCLVYNYYAGAANPTSCAMPTQGTNDNGDVAGVFDQDNVNASLSHTAAYTYDALNRLETAAATGNATYHLTYEQGSGSTYLGYDRFGNMTCVQNAQTQGLCPQYSFNPANNEVSTPGFTYDAAGDLTSDGTNTFGYDAEGREISANGPSNWAATYNAFGQVIQRYLASQGETDSFLWDPSGRLSANWTQNHGWWWDEFVWADGMPFSDNRQLESTAWFLHADRLGSTRGVSTTAGQIMWENLDFPWGQNWEYAGSNWGFFAGMGVNWGAISQTETPHRNYMVGPSRWLTPDPLGGDITNPQSLNRYAYVLNNPATLTDPSGLGPAVPCTIDGQPGLCTTVNSTPMPPLGGPSGSWDPGIPLRYHPGSPGGGGGIVPPKLKPNVIPWSQLQKLVHENNESNLCDDLIDCIVFKESTLDNGFNANALGRPFVPPPPEHGGVQQARGLMQITQDTAAEINRLQPMAPSAGALYQGLFSPAINIFAGSTYLQYLYGKYGSESGALAHYGPKGYADEIRNCVEQLQRGNFPGAEAAAHGH